MCERNIVYTLFPSQPILYSITFTRAARKFVGDPLLITEYVSGIFFFSSVYHINSIDNIAEVPIIYPTSTAAISLSRCPVYTSRCVGLICDRFRHFLTASTTFGLPTCVCVCLSIGLHIHTHTRVIFTSRDRT